MKMTGNTVLITGGASGIGLGLATAFLQVGNEVIICGRRAEKLNEAKERYPELTTHVADVETPEGRRALQEWACARFPKLNVLVNNAGIQRQVSLKEPEKWEETRREIAINLDAPIHLSQLFLPHLMQQPQATIVNITSGLAFVPLARTPVYCATKAALHSFTMSLRHQLASTSVRVIEVAPPAVNTDLGGPGLHTFGVPVDAFVSAVVARIAAGELEIGYGMSEDSRLASREQLNQAFVRMNG